VTYSGYNGNYGNMIVISHGYDYETVYAHNNKNAVKVGDRVTKGDLIAYIGTTGRSTGPHVHFEVHFEGKQINPRKTLTDY
ncbi:MAG: M23 family metallopeptidase, partial [Bacillota bacterium]|nr:M23 family metallopeptidase [Bacillota bacterium]